MSAVRQLQDQRNATSGAVKGNAMLQLVKTDLKTNATGRHLMETNVTLAVYADK
jgi:hypothetical protein